MKLVRNLDSGPALLALAFLLFITGAAEAQAGRVAGGTISQADFGFYWETRLDPASPPLAGSFSTGATSEAGVVHRYMFDRTQNIFLGYDAIIKVLPERNTYQVTFRALTMTPDLQRQFSRDEWSRMPTPGWTLPAPQILHGGDVLSLDLLTNPSTNQRVVDYITVQEPAVRFNGFTPIPERAFSYATGPARDFKTDDVELLIQSPRLSINGKLDETSTTRYDSVVGGIVWIYANRHGRFLLSLIPHPELGFRRAGEVRGSSLKFIVGNDTFDLNAGGRIAPGQAAYTLYVLHQPDWKPSYAFADTTVFIMGALDRSELPKK